MAVVEVVAVDCSAGGEEKNRAHLFTQGKRLNRHHRLKTAKPL